MECVYYDVNTKQVPAITCNTYVTNQSKKGELISKSCYCWYQANFIVMLKIFWHKSMPMK